MATILCRFVFPVLFSPVLLAASPPGSATVAEDGGGVSPLLVGLIVVGTLGLAALSVGALTMWGRKQDDIPRG